MINYYFTCDCGEVEIDRFRFRKYPCAVCGAGETRVERSPLKDPQETVEIRVIHIDKEYVDPGYKKRNKPGREKINLKNLRALEHNRIYYHKNKKLINRDTTGWEFGRRKGVSE
jgi:hypothetical protein